MAKLEKAVVLYFIPEIIGEAEGASCGKCMMYFGGKDKGRCTVVEGSIDAQHGVCGLYVNGKHEGPELEGVMPKHMAGYVTNGPSQCGNCEYFVKSSQACRIVEGLIEAHGCCNAWERKDD